MSRSCSLRLDLIENEEELAWQLFHRTSGINPSIAGVYKLPSQISPEVIHSQLEELHTLNDRTQFRSFGTSIKDTVFPGKVIKELEKYDSGDILFMVSPQWADIPFETFHISRGFIGEIFRSGTIIRIQSETESEKAIPYHNRMLIIADPAGNLQSAY